ncbi:auxin-responsive protein SAUR50-like [Salvia hispanica]|uniref:auxin-responsive protein SAUR50-like n=1 Tax=Salvia hispanica TaxID=49212 RepID=UPI00200900B5|nr:auxin-responsive protein SAUR50-like [Salvia hispanica]
MSSAMKKMNAINQIVRLKQVMRSWKNKSRYEPADLNPRTPSGSVAVYVGRERHRFVVPTRFLNFPVFVALLNQAEEEFGYQATGGIALPCDAGFFGCIMELLQKDEKNLHGLGLHEFVQMVAEARFRCKQVGSKSVRGHSIKLEPRINQSCKRYYSSPPPPNSVTPLLQKTRI